MLDIVLTGGGSLAISELMVNGGASEFLNSVTIPYGKDALKEYTFNSVSVETSEEMASKKYAEFGNDVIAVTASLRKKNFVSEQYLDGSIRKNRAYISIIKNGSLCSIEFFFTHNTRQEQEKELCNVILKYIGYILTVIPSKPTTNIIYCGSFNPLHKGHVGIIEELQKIGPVSLELCTNPQDKDLLSPFSLYNRVVKLNYDLNECGLDCHVYATDHSKFIDKFKHLKNCKVAIGLDTLYRINNFVDELDELNKLMAERNCHFIVFDRKDTPSFSNKVVNVTFNTSYIDTGISSTKVRNGLHQTN